MMMSMYEGQEEDGAVVIPNASITPGMSSDPPNTSLPLPLIPANLSWFRISVDPGLALSDLLL